MRDLEAKKQYQKEYYLRNKEKLLDYRKDFYSKNRTIAIQRSKEWVEKNPEARKRNWLKSTYKISLEEYNQMFADQKGFCLCCEIHQSKCSKAFHIDHDHITGKVRGLLCSKCNSALGFVKDNIQTLRNMIKYLEENAESDTTA